MSKEVLVGFDKPWAKDPEFIEALRRCNVAKYEFVPVREWAINKAEQMKNKDKGEK